MYYLILSLPVAKRLGLYQVLSPNAYSRLEGFVPILNKTVSSTVHEVLLSVSSFLCLLLDCFLFSSLVMAQQSMDHEVSLTASFYLLHTQCFLSFSSGSSFCGQVTVQDVPLCQSLYPFLSLSFSLLSPCLLMFQSIIMWSLTKPI